MHAFLVGLLSFAAIASASDSSSCSGLKSMVAATYGFRPSLLDQKGQDAKAREMDAVWQAVRKSPKALIPCLRDELAERTQDTWFVFDASQLLVSVDPSRDSKAILLAALKQVSLDDVDLRVWVETTSSLGKEGFDTSDVGRRWLTYPRAEYFLPEHGAYRVDRGNGGIFIFGSLDERYATPALAELCRTESGEAREVSAWLLMRQATPQALRALKELNPEGLSPRAQASLKALLEHPTLISPRASPKTSRKEFIAAFEAFVAGNQRPFERLVEKVPDGERDVVAVCTPADLELIRRVRRHYAARANQHAIEYYNVFSQILMTLAWRADEPAKTGGYHDGA